MESIVEAVANYARKTPAELCVADGFGEYTYAMVWENVCTLARFLCWEGVKEKDCIMVECTQDARFLICDLACELIGAVFVPVEHKASQDRVQVIAQDTDAKFFLYINLYDIPAEQISLDTVFENMKESHEPVDVLKLPDGNNTAEILYTTGTTGKSKGIEITNANNIALAENVKYGTEMKAGNRELIPLPLSHSHGLRCCYANFLNGSAVVLLEGVSNVKLVFEMIEKYHVTSMDLSPSAVMVLAKLSKGRFWELSPQMDYIQVGTAFLKEETKEILIQNFPSTRLYNFYGSTESGRTCVLDFNKERNKPGCIGRPTRNATFMITDEARNPIVSSEDNMGLLASAGSMNMVGYWKQPDLTRQIMKDGYVYTNDMGYIDEDGYIYVLGRKDDVINYKGIKISPEEIEEKVLKYPGITDCACVPKSDMISGQIPKLFVVVEERERLDKALLLQFLQVYIDDNKMPKEIEIIDEIPRTYNGKIQRSKLVDK